MEAGKRRSSPRISSCPIRFRPSRWRLVEQIRKRPPTKGGLTRLSAAFVLAVPRSNHENVQSRLRSNLATCDWGRCRFSRR
jgi:hypothetical protein